MPNPYDSIILLSELPISGPVFPHDFATTTTSFQSFSLQVFLCGFSLIETTGTATAEIDLWNGFNASSELVAVIALNPGQSMRDWYGFMGLYLDTGLYCQIVSGSVRGSVYLRR